MIRIVFLIRCLERGGAEQQLVLLASRLDRDFFAPTVVTFYSGGALEAELAKAGVPVVSVGKRGRWDLWSFGARLFHILHLLDPDIVHGYLPTANELATLGGRLCRAKVVWGVRSSNAGLPGASRLLDLTWRVGDLLAPHADLIIFNSFAGAAHYHRRGYPEAKSRVIPNGIDTERYAPLPEARTRLHAELRLSERCPVVGLVARVDPLKDHFTFLRAIAVIRKSIPDARFLCVGIGSEPLSTQLKELSRSLGIEENVVWLGARGDMPMLYNGMDLVVSSSLSEGFSNTIAEAMACGRPVVATDVGDSARIVGDTGATVPPGCPAALASAVVHLLSMKPTELDELGCRARERTIREFSVRQMTAATEAELTRLVQ